MADSKKYDGSQWEHSLRKQATATEAVENPLYSDGTTITSYTIKGNTVQNGTPSPSNPVAVNGVGERTSNLIFKTIPSANINASGQIVNDASSEFDLFVAKISQDTAYSGNGWVYAFYSTEPSVGSTSYNSTRYAQTPTNVTAPIDGYIVMRANHNTQTAMLNEGATAKPYEPYGYKIPILNGQASAVNYLGSVQSTRQIKKLVLKGDDTETWSMSDSTFGKRFSMTVSGARQSDTSQVTTYCTHLPLGVAGATYSQTDTYTITAASVLYVSRDSTFTSIADFKAWLSDQYTNGTPVTVWYVLQTATTGTVNEPLMKIGTYADTLSNAVAIPTIEGANTITVDTTVQPSEFLATWSGWHDSSVKEYDGSDWQ